MHVNSSPIRWAGQRYGANYSAPYPGENVLVFSTLWEAAQTLSEDVHGCAGDSLLLWSVSPHDSYAEVVSATRTDAAHADRIVTLGPKGGTRIERV